MSSREPGTTSGGDEQPQRAAVVPRAHRRGKLSSLPIERLTAPYLEQGAHGILRIIAPPGGGKTTALGHLRAALPAKCSIRLFDANQEAMAEQAAKSELVILAAEEFDPAMDALDSFELCPWTTDDCLEYLAARHRTRLAEVMKRICQDSSLAMLKGSPELLTFAMDRMAADSSLTSAMEVLRQVIATLNISESIRESLMILCCDRLGIRASELLLPEEIKSPALTMEQARWFRHAAVQRIFLAEWIAEELARRKIPLCLDKMSSRMVLHEIASAVASRGHAIETLNHLIADDPQHPAVAMAASILLRVNPTWRPAGKSPLNLAKADLRSAQWAKINLESARLTGADFTDADLAGANLHHVDAARVKLVRANLRDARLITAKFSQASFAGADLTQAVCDRTNLWHADFTGATLAFAYLSEADLEKANLHNAVLRGAHLRYARLRDANFDGADFSDADLREIRLDHAQMNRATWNRASFCNAALYRCNLEGLEISGVDFSRARLINSLLTGTHIIDGKFSGASLVRAGLAEIDWENADLRDADLTHASFHLGSSRSGLVGSTIPGEGSRTGFYTDEFSEQDFKSPEEIRKASLRGADLRGAKVEDADFYLVDLRDAKYNDTQRQHFAACGAILFARQ